jgi:non-ribosomal peptide synthetase-like protein
MTKALSVIGSEFPTSPTTIMYLHELFESQLDMHGNSPAIDGAASLTYQEVEERTNRIANYLRQLGVGPGKLVGLLFHRSELPILAILGVLKAGGGYVPLDLSYPDDRMRYVLTEAEVGVVICEAKTRHRIDDVFEGNVLVLDEAADKLAAQPSTRPSRTDIGLKPTDLCYVLFTSGTTGQPKGVMVEHRNAARFATAFNVVCETTPADRVFQGFALTFDGSVEEIWMAFSNGATLVVPTIDTPRFGDDLAEFMHKSGITYFSTVPTMLTTMQRDLPLLRQLVVSGEPCLPEHVDRWATRGRLMLNVYGPTEATVNTTSFVCKPGKPVTVGKPLPGYTVHIFDSDMNPVPQGTKGELYVSGIGITRGYLKRPDLTEKAYMLRPNDETRYYRSGDIARINDEGEIEFFGRADNQVKIRGYRVELSEIDALLSEQDNISIAVTKLHKGDDQDALASYVELRDPTQPVDRKAVLAGLRAKLPPYMLPTFFEVLERMPRLVSGKVDRKSLPEPCTPLVDYSELSLPQTEMEEKVAEAWRKLFKIEKVGIDQDFFLDLGGHSLLAAQMVTVLRQVAGVEMPVRDVYAYPKIALLAEHLQRLHEADATKPKAPKQTGAYLKDALDEIGKFYQVNFRKILNPFGRSRKTDKLSVSDARIRTHLREELEYHKARNRALGRPISESPTRFAAIVQGLIILTFFLLLSWPTATVITYADEVLRGGMSLLEGSLYLCIFSLAVFPTILTLSILSKWLIIGRYKPGSYPLWGAYYVRWWLVSSLHGLSGISMFTGTPVMPFFYRLMGAKVGRNCSLDTAEGSIWDCLTIGDDTSIGTDTQLLGYRIESGYLHIGKIDIGRQCFIGAHSVLGLNVQMQDGARLDDQSLLYDNEKIPAHEYRRGSPAGVSDVAVPDGDLKRYGMLRKAVFVISAVVCSILSGVFLLIPSLFLLSFLIIGYQQGWFLTATAIVFAAMPVIILVMCLWVALLKAIILRRAKPGVYELYSVYYLRYWLAFDLMRLVGSMMLPVFTTIYLPPFLRLLGAKLGKHCELSTMWSFMPELITAGDGSFFADGCILGGKRVFGGHFEIGANRVGARSFIGNSAMLPTGSVVGDDCLLGVLSTPPSRTVPVPNGSDWLGLPGFRLPNRQKVGSFDNKLTYQPSFSLYFQRAIIDGLRILIPAYISLGLGLTGIATLLYLYQVYGLNVTLAVTPPLAIALAVAAVMIVVALKWVVMGRFEPVIKPLWCHYIWLNEMVNGAYEAIMAPVTGILFGTPFAGIPLRLI